MIEVEINSSLEEEKRGKSGAVAFASEAGNKTPSSVNQLQLHDARHDMKMRYYPP